jgi:hypothetical protein
MPGPSVINRSKHATRRRGLTTPFESNRSKGLVSQSLKVQEKREKEKYYVKTKLDPGMENPGILPETAPRAAMAL